MNLNLQIKNGVLSSPSTLEVVMGLVVDKKIEQVVPIPELPCLKDVLKEIGPFPKEALFLGVADDNKPVLLNLWDPTPGPVLVVGDSVAAKTDFLKAIVHFIVDTYQSREVQFGVITSDPLEWDDQADFPHCAGIFSMAHKRATDFIQALTIWAEMTVTDRQPILLLIDGLDDLIYWDGMLSRDLQKILLYGPAKNIWPIVTVNLESFQSANAWLKYFRTRVFGYTKRTDVINNDDYCYTGFESLDKDVEYCLKESSQWIKFRIPRT